MVSGSFGIVGVVVSDGMVLVVVDVCGSEEKWGCH